MTISRSLLILPILLLAITEFLSCTHVRDSKEEKPNIIFLLADDLRWDALGAYGNPIIETPNIDQLANRGSMFENAYVTSSICCCSRASILTGQYLSGHGISDFDTDLSEAQLNMSYPLLLKHLSDYNIGFIGKYGVGLDHPKSAFDYWKCEDAYQPNYDNEDTDGNYIHYTDLTGQRIEECIDQFSEEDAPFCLSVSFKAPHVQDDDERNFIYKLRYKDLYKDVFIPVPETADSSYWSFFPEEFRTNNEARLRWKTRFSTPEMYQESVKGYYRLIAGIDDVVGELMKHLESRGLDENTIIIFMGDNGFFLGEHGLAGKWFAHNESVRVPLIIYDPVAEHASKSISEIALNIDIAPTILAAAGIDLPASMQGVNLLRYTEGKLGIKRDWFFYEQKINFNRIPKTEAIISKSYKYIRYPDIPDFEEFYMLENDPYEKNNLIHESRYQNLIAQQKEKLSQLKQETK